MEVLLEPYKYAFGMYCGQIVRKWNGGEHIGLISITIWDPKAHSGCDCYHPKEWRTRDMVTRSARPRC